MVTEDLGMYGTQNHRPPKPSPCFNMNSPVMTPRYILQERATGWQPCLWNSRTKWVALIVARLLSPEGRVWIVKRVITSARHCVAVLQPIG
jgi:hypothetical protein